MYQAPLAWVVEVLGVLRAEKGVMLGPVVSLLLVVLDGVVGDQGE